MPLTLPRALSLLMLMLAALAGAASILLHPRNVTVSFVSAQGTGCPSGTVSTTINPDGTAITFGFDSFATYIGPNYPPAHRAKNCVILVALRYPLGRGLEILTATYRGLAALDVGMTAIMESTYRIVNDGAGNRVVQTRASITGEFVGDYTEMSIVPEERGIGLPCGLDEARLQITTHVTLRSSNASLGGSLDGESPFSLGYHQVGLGWWICEG